MHPDFVKLKEFEKELKSETDRGAAIMAVTMIEWTLERMLNNFLVDSKITRDLFDPSNGLLGTLASKIKISYCLGLMTKLEHDECSRLRKIRNEFAHKFEINFSFENPKIKSLTDKFEIRETIEGKALKKARDVFINNALMMIRSFLFRRQTGDGRIEEEQNLD